MGRLMKYELRSALRLFIPVWLGLLVIALVNGLFIDNDLMFRMYLTDNYLLLGLQALMLFLYYMLILGLFIFAEIYVIIRFYQSTMKDEGYLTFTLPLSIDTVLWSKALSATILLMGSILICLLSVLLMAFWNIDWAAFKDGWATVNAELDGSLIPIILSVLVCIAASLLFSIFMLYLSMAIGQMSNKYRVLVSVAAYVGINTVLSTISNLCVVPLMFYLSDNYYLFPEQVGTLSLAQMIWSVIGISIVLNVIMSAVFYFPTRHIFAKKLNLI